MSSNKKRRDKTTSPAIKRTQLTLLLSWACAVHKLGFKFNFRSCQLWVGKQKSFNESQIYVALSRVTIIDTSFLVRKYNHNVFKVNEGPIIEYSRLQQNRFGRSCTDCGDCNSLTVSLLNARSLKRHAADINRARQLTDNDVQCLTESHITNDTGLTDIL